jgi:hypothetical protein
MPVGITPGTYALQFSSGQYFAAFSPDTQTALLSIDNGTLTILEHDTAKKHIRGNFSFTGKSGTDNSSAGISDGYFSVNY